MRDVQIGQSDDTRSNILHNENKQLKFVNWTRVLDVTFLQ